MISSIENAGIVKVIIRYFCVILPYTNQVPKPTPHKKATRMKTMTAGIVKETMIRVYYKYDKGLRYPARGAIGIRIVVPHTLLT